MGVSSFGRNNPFDATTARSGCILFRKEQILLILLRYYHQPVVSDDVLSDAFFFFPFFIVGLSDYLALIFPLLLPVQFITQVSSIPFGTNDHFATTSTSQPAVNHR